ncbi:cell envelope integrity protein TolA [Parashewanella spongiae]|uniref:Cell envelope integrity protein TolA n=1 Tax=Parashewanella spongiae TaxID=342950 RepID=A0A3A6UMP4_9GAMM|nr:cell envelope integrity protein TolA [Parashewanella spongiae]MCL1078563.1 cell envelope integrity protein TolA [Parashewanella spongiae]RJY19020.1 cell envelope integrity protein TolA [Parashewanella spongiae]
MVKQSTLTLSIVISLVVHVGVIAALAVGVDFNEKPKALPQSNAPIVKAIVVDQKLVAAQVEKIRKQKENAKQKEIDRQRELERKLEDARKARKKEQDKIKNLERERKRKQNEADKAAAAAKAHQIKQQKEKEKAAKAERIRKQKEKEQRSAEKAAQRAKEKRRQEEAAAKKAEQERKRKAEAERKRKADAAEKARQEKELAEALAAEQSVLEKTRNRQVLSEVQKYKALITQTIKRNLVVDPSMKGKTCKVNIRLAKDGFVISTKTVSGDPVVCRASKTAITKAGRLPVSADAHVYNQMKDINLEVSPEFN